LYYPVVSRIQKHFVLLQRATVNFVDCFDDAFKDLKIEEVKPALRRNVRPGNMKQCGKHKKKASPKSPFLWAVIKILKC